MNKKLEVKTILLGDSAVGKTSLLTRIVRDTFDEDVASTIGATYSYKSLSDVKNYDVQLQIWDTAGQERYRCLAPIYYHDTQIVFLVYACDDKNSFNIIDFWTKDLEQNNAKPSLLVLIGNKCELERGENGVDTAEGNKKADDINALFCEVSAKTNCGIQEMLDAVALKYVENLEGDEQRREVENKPIPAENGKKDGGCCS